MDRFWDKVHKTNDCWLWISSITGEGYGSYSINGISKGAHIVSWEMSNNKSVPKGFQVLHTCDVRHCVNPSHLWLGTCLENIKDNKNRQSKGEENGRHKLTESQALFIKNSKLSGKKLGKMFGISHTQANEIKRGTQWKYLK